MSNIEKGEICLPGAISNKKLTFFARSLIDKPDFFSKHRYFVTEPVQKCKILTLQELKVDRSNKSSFFIGNVILIKLMAIEEVSVTVPSTGYAEKFHYVIYCLFYNFL